MHALRILQQRLRRQCPDIHLRRLRALFACVAAALFGQRLTLTELGHALPSAAHMKHNIKRVDRLLGNARLNAERFGIYQAIARWFLSQTQRPILVVDWSALSADGRWHLLRAALPVGGRTLTLYEEVHPQRQLGNRGVQHAFLHRLKALLPPEARPIVISDAGFRVPWFEAVSLLGWHWIGRVRNRELVRAYGSETWMACKSLHDQARALPRSLGAHELVRNHPIVCNLYLVKRPRKHRIDKSVFGKRVHSTESLRQAKANREPWLLAASPSLASLSELAIVNLYAQRMQIEEAFRDLKCQRYGLGFERHLSRTRERIEALLIVAFLALLALWLIGREASRRGLHAHYQSTTRSSRPVLSLLRLACLMLRHAFYASPPRRLDSLPTSRLTRSLGCAAL